MTAGIFLPAVFFASRVKIGTLGNRALSEVTMKRLSRVIRPVKKSRRTVKKSKFDLSYRATGTRLVSKSEQNRAFNKR